MAQVEINLAAETGQVGEPWLWRLSREFNVRINIRRANVNPEFGSVTVELDGPIEEIQRATAWLMTTGLRVEAMQRAVGA